MSHGLTPGLASVTLRNYSRAEVVKYAKTAGLKAIEWSGDTHVPAGDAAAAEEAKSLCDEAGLIIAGYGSYWRAGEKALNKTSFSQVIETTAILGAPFIRIWAGAKPSEGAYDSYRSTVVADAKAAAREAAAANLVVCFEYQANTLNDTADSALALLESAGEPNLKTYWQADYTLEHEDRLRGLEDMRKFVTNVHVFHWPSGQRAALAGGSPEWRKYFTCLADKNAQHYVLLEFVERDYPENLSRDAADLLDLLSEV